MRTVRDVCILLLVLLFSFSSLALAEVENALANEQLIAKRLPYAETALADRTRAVEIATVQYRAGSRDLLWVAQLQTEQLVAQETVIKLRNMQGANRIHLYLALGGSFNASPPDTLPEGMTSTSDS